MGVLLDTHSLLWFLEGNVQLSSSAKSVIEDTEHEVFVSNVSFYEAAIKLAIGKLNLEVSLAQTIENTLVNGIKLLPLGNSHIIAYERIPLSSDHRDPFDRMLVAVALTEHCTLITRDKKFNRYQDLVPLFW